MAEFATGVADLRKTKLAQPKSQFLRRHQLDWWSNLFIADRTGTSPVRNAGGGSAKYRRAMPPMDAAEADGRRRVCWKGGSTRAGTGRADPCRGRHPRRPGCPSPTLPARLRGPRARTASCRSLTRPSACPVGERRPWLFPRLTKHQPIQVVRPGKQLQQKSTRPTGSVHQPGFTGVPLLSQLPSACASGRSASRSVVVANAQLTRSLRLPEGSMRHHGGSG